VRDVQVLDDARRGERVEVAVERGEVAAGEPAVEAAGEPVGADGAVGGEQRLEHEPPGGGDAVAVGAQHAEG
jgi:hypothetical protein